MNLYTVANYRNKSHVRLPYNYLWFVRPYVRLLPLTYSANITVPVRPVSQRVLDLDTDIGTLYFFLIAFFRWNMEASSSGSGRLILSPIWVSLLVGTDAETYHKCYHSFVDASDQIWDAAAQCYRFSGAS